MRRHPATANVRAGVPAHFHVDSTVACPRCGLAAAWGALVPMKVLEGAALESHLTVPADGWFVDVRACSGCGRPLARKVRRP